MNGSRAGTEPRVEMAWVNRGIWATTNPATSSGIDAVSNAARSSSTSSPAKYGDDRAGGEQQERRLDDAAERDPAQLGELGRVDAGGLGRGLAQRLDVELAGLGRGAQVARQRGRCRKGRSAASSSSPRAARALAIARLGAGQRRQADQQLGVVRVDQSASAADAASVKSVSATRAVVAHRDRPRREVEVGDARRVKRAQRSARPTRRRRRRTHSAPSDATRSPSTDQHQHLIGALLVARPSARATPARPCTSASSVASVSRSSPGTRADAQRRAVVAVHQRAPQPEQPPLLGDVSPEHLDQQPVAPARRVDQHDAVGLAREPLDLDVGDADRVEQRERLLAGDAAGRRAHDQPRHGGRGDRGEQRRR